MNIIYGNSLNDFISGCSDVELIQFLTNFDKLPLTKQTLVTEQISYTNRNRITNL